MRGKTLRLSMLCRLIIALVLALCLTPISHVPVAALSVDDYFAISYSVKLSKDEIRGGEVFYATITGQATCIKDLPLSVSEAVITGRVVAEHNPGGTKVALSSNYTLSISPFPNKTGEAAQASQTVALQFPADSTPGSYNVSGELVEARVRAVLWFTVTSYLPPSQPMGSVNYTQLAPEPTPAEPPAGTTIIAGKIDWQGIIIETITAPSPDSKCILTLYKGTKALYQGGLPLQEISIVDIKEPPAPPENRSIVGLAYNISPNGTTFEPPAVLALKYDGAQIPEGVGIENLVLATWDETTGEWLELELFTIDPLTNSITAQVSHLTTFAIMAQTAPPASTISEPIIPPVEEPPNEVKVEDTVAATTTALDIPEPIIPPAGDKAGDAVTTALAPTIPEPIIPPAEESPNEVKVEDTVAATTPTLTPSPTSTTASVPLKTTNWWLIGGIYAGDIALLIMFLRLIRRQRRKPPQINENK